MDSESLQTAFFRASHRFRKAHLHELFDELPRGEFFALDMLRGHQAEHPQAEGVYVSDLAHMLESSPPLVSRGLKALEAKGYIERQVDQADRRNTYIRITPEGAAAHDMVKCRMYHFTQRVFEAMGDEDVRRLIELWNRLIDITEQEMEKSDKGEQACSKS